MKILCVCLDGTSRSVGTRHIINLLGTFDILACGVRRQTPETLTMLANWADKILLAERNMIDKFPIEYHNKIDRIFELGPDVWNNPLHPDLQEKIREQLKKINFL